MMIFARGILVHASQSSLPVIALVMSSLPCFRDVRLLADVSFAHSFSPKSGAFLEMLLCACNVVDGNGGNVASSSSM